MWALMVLSCGTETSMLKRERGHKLASKGKPDPVREKLRGLETQGSEGHERQLEKDSGPQVQR